MSDMLPKATKVLHVAMASTIIIACDLQPEATDLWRTERDSAGIQIVENRRPLWGASPKWRVSDRPTLDIGDAYATSGYALSSVRSAVRLTNGRIVVADGSSNELRFFDTQGQFEQWIGGNGDGPGEFRNLSWLGRTDSDSLIAFDEQHRRVSVFTSDGVLIDSRPLQGTDPLVMIGVLRDGLMVMRVRTIAERVSESEIQRSTTPYVKYSPLGSAMDTLARVLGTEYHLARGGLPGRVPFGRTSLAAVHIGALYLGDTDSYELQEIAPADGAIRRIIRKQHTPRVVTDAHLEAFAQQLMSEVRGPARQIIADILTEAPHRSTMPAFQAMLTDYDGNLWVADYRSPADQGPELWSVFDTSGRFLGIVSVQENFRPTDIGRDYVLGVWTDSLDVEHVRMYGLNRH